MHGEVLAESYGQLLVGESVRHSAVENEESRASANGVVAKLSAIGRGRKVVGQQVLLLGHDVSLEGVVGKPWVQDGSRGTKA